MQIIIKRFNISISSFFVLLLFFVDGPSNQLSQPSFLGHPKDTTAQAQAWCAAAGLGLLGRF